ncbi:MAG: ACT domain-containing protein [Chloroflexota bacterium]
MTSITDLKTLLKEMAPRLREGVYVFATFKSATYGDRAELEPVASFQEDEGLTLVIPKEQADNHQIPYETTLNAITLTVHSSLEAVGLTAAVANKLAEHGISANVIAAFYHDHIFVPSDRAEDALNALRELSD